jgi:hypothetical protein
MVEAVIRAVDRNVPVSLVHATRGNLFVLNLYPPFTNKTESTTSDDSTN